MESSFKNQIDFLQCAICLDDFRDPYCLPCLHSFCKSCIESHASRKEKFSCPLCCAMHKVGSWQKDYRIIEFINYVNRSQSHDSSCLKLCKLCDGDVDPHEVHLCQDCTAVLCMPCTINHKRVTQTKSHNILPLSSEKIPMCFEHEKKFELYCNETKCKIAICVNCALVGHQGHKMISINEQGDIFKKEISKFIEQNDAKIKELNSSISNYKDLKRHSETEFKHIELLLTQRRNELIDSVHTAYKQQMDSVTFRKNTLFVEMQKNIGILENAQEKLRKFTNSALSYLNSKAFHEVSDFCSNIGNVHEDDVDVLFNISYLKSFSISEFDVNSVQEKLSSCLGLIDFHFGTKQERCFMFEKPVEYFLNNQPCLVYTHCTSKNSIVDVVSDSKSCFALMYDGTSNSTLLKLLPNQPVKKLAISNNSLLYFGSFLAPMSNGDVLTLYFSKENSSAKLIQVFNDLSGFNSFPVNFFNMSNLELICSNSSCLYFYLNSSLVFKYNIATAQYFRFSVKLPDTAKFMSASENANHIAFSADGKIFIFSLENNEFLHSIQRSGVFFDGLSFLQPNVLITFSSGSLFLVNVESGKLVYEFNSVKDNETSVQLKHPYCVANSLPHSFCLVDYCSSSKRYKIIHCRF